MKIVRIILWLLLCTTLLSPNEALPKRRRARPPLSETIQNTMASRPDTRFVLVVELSLTVPETYVSATQLATFRELHASLFTRFNDGISNKNFSETVQELKSGKTYKVKIFSLAESVSYKDCRQFCKREKAILPGAQGLSLLWELKRDVLWPDKFMVAFAARDLFIERNKENVNLLPFICRFSNGHWWFELLGVDYDLSSDYCLVCFYEQ